MNGQVRVTFIKDDFNKVVELTNIFLNNSSDDENKESKKFFNKIMTYSFIKDEKVIITFRVFSFFPVINNGIINILYMQSYLHFLP